MSKDLTVKDVLYAMEYLHDAMVRTPPQSMGGKGKWNMKATGATVREAIANEVRSSGKIEAFDERDGRQVLMWAK